MNTLAKITSYGMKIDPTGKKADCVWVEFEKEDKNRMTWFGYMSAAAAPYTVEKLVTIFGLTADPANIENYLTRLGSEGIDSGLLNTEKEYELVIENEEYNGRQIPKIKYVNDPSAPARFGKIATEQLKGRYASLNLGGVVAGLKTQAPPF